MAFRLLKAVEECGFKIGRVVTEQGAIALQDDFLGSDYEFDCLSISPSPMITNQEFD